MPDEPNNKLPSRFAEVKRQAGERRALADRRSSTRRAAELQEIARQLAARGELRKPSVGAPEPLPERPADAIKDDPA